jgi:GDPmannose 4,6-dehydratase
MHSLNGDQVWGSTRTSLKNGDSTFNIIEENLQDSTSANKCLEKIKPNFIYHLAAIHFDSTINSFSSSKLRKEMYECHVNITKNILNWQSKNLDTKSIIALSSQMYSGNKNDQSINESSICNPQNYYAETKVEAFNLIRFYRNNYHTNSNGAILFNHTSIKSKKGFLFPKLAKQMFDVIYNKSDKIFLDNPNKQIDICHASDVCEGLFKFMSYKPACDLIFSSGKLIKITDLIRQTFVSLRFSGSYDIIETGVKSQENKVVVGDIRLTKRLISWTPTKNPVEILTEQILKISK